MLKLLTYVVVVVLISFLRKGTQYFISRVTHPSLTRAFSDSKVLRQSSLKMKQKGIKANWNLSDVSLDTTLSAKKGSHCNMYGLSDVCVLYSIR